MEQTVLFRDYQEEQSDDFNNLQVYAQQSFDDLVKDAVTASLRYSGFSTSITGTAEVTIAPGRFYGPNLSGENGAVFTLPSQTIMSLVAYLAVASQRYLTLVASGQVDNTNNQTRDFLTNITTGQTEPQVVSMTASRDAVLQIIQGTEAPAPQPPAIPANKVAICNILVSNSAVLSVTMLPAGLVTSTEALDMRLSAVEVFDAQVEAQVTTLTSDLATLANEIGNAGQDRALIIELMQDMALVKTKVQLPSTYAQYGASYFLFADATQFDITNINALGYNANIFNGVRFPWQNADTFALSIFNSLDPNANYHTSSGLLLPAYKEVIRLQTGTLPTQAGPGNTPSAVTGTVALGQYGYQTFSNEELNIPYYRIRSGGTYYQCSNGNSGWSAASTTDNGDPYWLPSFSTYQIQSGSNYDFFHGVQYTDYLWVDSWTEPYWTLEAVAHTINGALIAQTMLIGSDTWLTKVGIWIATVASNTDIIVSLVQCTNGQPDMTKVLTQGTLAGATLTQGMNFLSFNPTFVSQGMRIAVVLTTMANHSIGLVTTGSFTAGTFFYSLDGVYFLGDFTKTLAVQLWGCQFNSSQVTIQLGALNLAGGIRNIDLSARMQIPGACQLTFEVQPSGSGNWIPISPDAPLAPFAVAPVLCNFQVRFVGSQDIMPGVILPDSVVTISAPGTTLKFVTLPETLLAASTNINVKVRVEAFNPIAHTLTAAIYPVTGTTVGAVVNPTTTTTTLVQSNPNLTDANAGNYDIQFAFSPASLTKFIIVLNGTTNSVADQFLVASMVWWAL